MPKLTIDNREVEVPAGATLLDAARQLGLPVPTLCFMEGAPPRHSCMVCVVKVQGLRRLAPSCAYPARDGLVVESETPEVHAARRTAIELLLGEHLGDCVGPCVSVCPAHMDIPRMLAQIKAGRLREALITVKEMIALPAILGYICPAPCEKACRRADLDQPVAICLMKRYVAEVDLASTQPYLPPCAAPSGKKVALIGAGPAGLSAAWYLLQAGHACVLYDARELAGGQVRYAVPEAKLPRAVLDAEIAVVEKLGAQFRMKQALGTDFSLPELRRDYDAVVLAVGDVTKEKAAAWGLPFAGRGLKAENQVVPCALGGIFAAGATLAPSKLAVRDVASGRAAALAVCQFLAGKPVKPEQEFVIHMGKLDPEDLVVMMHGVNSDPRMAHVPVGPAPQGQAAKESGRCLQCGCLKADDCDLRKCATQYNAHAAKYRGERREFERDVSHHELVYERGKCITCGKCIQVAAAANEKLGLAFVGRGFSMRVAVPFHVPLAPGLTHSAKRAAAECPTAALAVKPPPA